MSYVEGKNIVCGFDVSGTSIRLEVFEKQKSGKLEAVGERITRDLPAGIKEDPQSFKTITDLMNLMVRDGVQNIEHINSLEAGVSVAARFEKPDGTFPQYDDGSAFVQQEVSGINFGKNCWKQDWKGGLEQKIADTLGKKLDRGIGGIPDDSLNIKMLNDAGILQLAVHKHAEDEGMDVRAWRGGKIMSLSPGTGFGSSVAEVDMNGTIKVRHNSHLYDALVGVSKEQANRIRKVFNDGFGQGLHNDAIEVSEHKLSELQKHVEQEGLEPFGEYFPLENAQGKKLVHIIEENGQYYIVPERFFASKNGIQHLVGFSDDDMKTYGKMSKDTLRKEHPDAAAKLELIGELMGAFITQYENGALRRIFPEKLPPMPYDGDKSVPLKAVFLGGGGLRDTIGAIIEDKVSEVIAQKGSVQMRNATIYRPHDRRTTADGNKPFYNICEAAAERAVELAGRQRSMAV